MKALIKAAALALALSAVLAGTASAADEFDKYALESASVALSSSQAGAHADLTIGFQLSEKEAKPYAQSRDVYFHLPPGAIGNPQAISRCTVDQLGVIAEESNCPFSSQIGISEVTVGGLTAGTFTEPVYNMVSPTGETDVIARLGLYAGPYPAVVNVRLDPTDYSLVATLEGAPSAAGLTKATTTIWGVPQDPSHNEDRVTPLEALGGEKPLGGRPPELPPRPFLSNPTDCGLQRQLTITAHSYQLPDQPSTKTVPFPPIAGCGKLNFNPSFTAAPTNPEAAAPTGLDTVLTIPQDETPNGRATSNLKSARVTLPAGMAINPAAGDGLAACSPSQVGYGTTNPSACPQAAKIGAIEVEVPALEDTLKGAVYQRTPEPGHLFRFWVVTDEQGVHLKLPAEIEANPITGQLSTVFNGIESLGGLPQVPFSELRLHVFGGPRAPLATPSSCGTYQTQYSFAPWSGKPAVTGQTAMQITQGCGKGGFSPKISAGGRVSAAGAFSPFTFTLTRQDGEANPQKIALHLPQGLLAKLGGVPLCPQPAATMGTCPADSKIGSLAASAGVGGAPLWIPQPGKAPTAVYLAGPYKGGPFSVVSVVPAQAGPFDLGLVVNRAAIQVDPETALATIVTDPLPQILEGVPVAYRTIHVLVDRPNFTLNPTSCAKKKIVASITASDGSSAEPTDGFQATNCEGLRYTPKLRLAFKGSTRRTGNPAVHAVLTQPAHQANTKAATVILPGSEFIDNAHISNPCTRVQFNEAACPKASILGHAEATTPLLDKPLKGPVYFRSNGGDRELPDIVADLKGQIHVTLVGYIDSVNGQVRTRFLHVPDAPVTKFKMNLFGGKRGLIENSEELCLKPRRVEIRLKAQNDRSRNPSPKIGLGCGKGT